MIVRDVTPADRAEWIRMRSALWPDAAENHPAVIDALLAASPTGGVSFVAERGNGGLAGFLELSTRSHAEGCSSTPVPYIEGWYVDPDVRESGIGRDLVAAAEHWARLRGFSEIASDCELDNDVSRQAHAALGYSEVARTISFRRALSDPC